MNIETFSDKTAEALYDHLGLADVSDLYYLDYDKIKELPGFGEKKVENLRAAIERSKTRPLAAFIYALGIPGIGSKTGKDLAQRYGSINALAEATEDDLLTIEGVGPILARNIVEYFQDERARTIIRRMEEAGVSLQYERTAVVQSAFTGKKVVLTGTLEKYTRKEASEIIERLGGEVASSQLNDRLRAGGRECRHQARKAQAPGVRIISERIR